MSQGTFPLSCSQSGQLFSDDLNSLLKGINSTNSGTTAPSSGLEEGVLWLDTSEAATPVLKIYDASVPGFIVLGVNGDSFKTVVIYKNGATAPDKPTTANTILNAAADGFATNDAIWSLTQDTPGSGLNTFTSVGTFRQVKSTGAYAILSGAWTDVAQLSGNDGSTGARSAIIGFYVPMVTRDTTADPDTFTSPLANFNPDGLLGTNTDNQAYLDASFSQFFFGNLTSDAVEGDYGVFYNNSVETENLVASYDAASGNWITGTKKISGNLFVDGSIEGDALDVNALTSKIVKSGKNSFTDTQGGFFLSGAGDEFVVGGDANNQLRWDGSNLTIPALAIGNGITSTQIADGAITTNKIQAGAITAVEIEANSISADKLTSIELSVEKKLSVGNIKVGAEDELAVATEVDDTSIQVLDTTAFPTTGSVLIGGTETFVYNSKTDDTGTPPNALISTTGDKIEAVFGVGIVVIQIITGYPITFGTGVVLDGSGKFAVGSVDESLVFDGTNLVLSGVPIDANDLVEVAALDGKISASLQTFSAMTAYSTSDVVIGPNLAIWRAKNDTTEPTAGTCTIGENDNRSACEGRGGIWTVTGTNADPENDSTNWEEISAGAVSTLPVAPNVADDVTTKYSLQVVDSSGTETVTWEVATDNNTTYTAGNGLDLTGTVFSTDIKANSGLKITSSELDLDLGASGITGTLDETDGGTGLTSYATGDIMYASSANVLAKLTKGSNGQVLKMGASNIPAWGTDNDNNTTYTAGNGLDLTGTVFSTDIKANSGLKITSSELDLDLGASGITGTLDETDGGTGLTSYATGDIMYASSANVLAKLTKGSNGQVLKMGASNIPAWGTDNDNNTTYTAGNGLDLTGTVFSTDIKANSGLKITSSELDLDLGASGITGTLDETDGGTGLTSYATGDIMYASSANVLAKLTKGSNGQVLKMGASNIPAWGTDNDNNTTYTAGNGLDLTGTVFSTDIKANSGLKITSSELDLDLGASGITGTLDETDGGTGLTSYATGDIMYASSANVLAKLTKGSNGQVLKMGASNIPAWGTDNDNNTTYTAGNGLDLTGTVFSTDLDGSTLTNSASGLKLTTHTGDVTGLTALTIGSGKVAGHANTDTTQQTGVEIAIGTIGTPDLRNASVNNDKLGIGSISIDKMAITEFPTVVWKTSYTTRDSSPDANGDWQPFENTALDNPADNGEAWSDISGIKLFDTDAAGRNISALITALDPGSYIRINQAGTATGATSIASGNTYTILTVGSTDFTAIGSSDNNVGTTFTASGVGTGSGTTTLNRFGVFKISAKPTGAGVAGSRSIFFASRFQSSDTYSTTAATSLDFQVKTDAIIDGNLIVTGTIDTTAIRADSGVFNSLSADEGNFGSLVADTASIGSLSADFLDAGLILADKIIAGSIIADKIAAGAITADKITVDGNINILPPTDENDRSVQGWADSTAAAPIVRDWSPKGIDGTGTGQSAVPVANALDDILGLTANKSTDSSGTNVTIAADIGSSGFFLGQTDEGPRFFIGNADGANSQFMKWNGSQLIVAGDSLVQLNASKAYYYNFNPDGSGGENGFNLNGTWCIKDDRGTTSDNKDITAGAGFIRQFGDVVVSANFGIRTGNTYTILTVGTSDFTPWGAANNNVGTTFTATAFSLSGGTGTATLDNTVQQLIFNRTDMGGIDVGTSIFDNVGVGSTCRVTRVLDRTTVADIISGTLYRIETTVANEAGPPARSDWSSVGGSSDASVGQTFTATAGASASELEDFGTASRISLEVVDFRVLDKTRVDTNGDADAAGNYEWFRVVPELVSGTNFTFLGGYGGNDERDDHDIVEFSWRYYDEANQGIELGSLLGSNSYSTHIALGNNTVANNRGSIVTIGAGSQGLGESSIAIGNAAIAGTQTFSTSNTSNDTGDFAIAIGNGAQALGDNSVAIGNAKADDVDSIYIGNRSANDESGPQSISIGRSSSTNGATGSIAIGNSADALFNNSGAFGNNATARDINIVTLGGDNDAFTPIEQIVELSRQTTTGDNDLAVVTKKYLEDNSGGNDFLAIQTTSGTVASATGTDGIAIGKGAKAAGTNTMALGNGADSAKGQQVTFYPEDLITATSGNNAKLNSSGEWKITETPDFDSSPDSTTATGTLSNAIKQIMFNNRDSVQLTNSFFSTTPSAQNKRTLMEDLDFQTGDKLTLRLDRAHGFFESPATEGDITASATITFTLTGAPVYHTAESTTTPDDSIGNAVEVWRIPVEITTAEINTIPGVTTGSVVLSATGSRPAQITLSKATPENVIVLGNEDITGITCNATVISALSDKRDKADIVDLPEEDGLPFITALKPRSYHWDRREWYEDGVPDGTKKEETYDPKIPNSGKRMGFIAQEVEEIIKDSDCISDSNLVTGNTYKKQMAYAELITPMVKAIQQLSEENDALKARLDALENP